MPQQNPRLGELIDRLVRTLAAFKAWSMTATMTYVSERTHYGTDMVHRWRQGRSSPSSETLEILATMGKDDANLSREWGESLLNAAYHHDTIAIVNKLWGPKEIRTIPCSLPSRDRTELIGRQAEIARLFELLSPDHAAHVITVDGIGGVGKTALVLEVAYRCWKASTNEAPNPKVPLFDTIIFVSAKHNISLLTAFFQAMKRNIHCETFPMRLLPH